MRDQPSGARGRGKGGENHGTSWHCMTLSNDNIYFLQLFVNIGKELGPHLNRDHCTGARRLLGPGVPGRGCACCKSVECVFHRPGRILWVVCCCAVALLPRSGLRTVPGGRAASLPQPPHLPASRLQARAMSKDVVDKAERKRLKKMKKEAAAAAAAEAEAKAAAAGPAPPAQEKEKKKKKRKQDKAAEASASEGTTSTAGPAAPPPKTKKPKKGGDGASPAAGGLAEVGDRELAAHRPALIKALYSEPAAVAAQTAAELAAWREERRIALEGTDQRPVTAFAQTGLNPKQLHAVRNFAAPSPIQAQCLPIALSGRDLVGIAATGSGKTLAFGLPALAHIAAQVRGGVVQGRKPVALVIAPTRELAIQIHTVLEEAGAPCDVKCARGLGVVMACAGLCFWSDVGVAGWARGWAGERLFGRLGGMREWGEGKEEGALPPIRGWHCPDLQGRGSRRHPSTTTPGRPTKQPRCRAGRCACMAA